jgi:hypothetical protein
MDNLTKLEDADLLIELTNTTFSLGEWYERIGRQDPELREREKAVVSELRRRLASRCQQRDAAVAALEAVEWVGPDDECPWCGHIEFLGHRDSCQREAALAMVRE